MFWLAASVYYLVYPFMTVRYRLHVPGTACSSNVLMPEQAVHIVYGHGFPTFVVAPYGSLIISRHPSKRIVVA